MDKTFNLLNMKIKDSSIRKIYEFKLPKGPWKDYYSKLIGIIGPSPYHLSLADINAFLESVKLQHFSKIHKVSFQLLKQVHGNTVLSNEVQLKNSELDLPLCKIYPLPEADGHIISYNKNQSDIKSPLLVPVIFSADCIPLLILGTKGLSFLHVGWRGLQSQIYKDPSFNNINPTFAFSGPSICKNHFHVTNEFLDHFPSSPFFNRHPSGQLTFSMEDKINQDLELLYGIKNQLSGICTYEYSHFPSYRKNKTNLRIWNLLLP